MIKEKGLNVQLDLPGQVEFNRKKNVEQDNQLATINQTLKTILEQNPAGFLPRVYYGLNQGAQTYRCLPNAIINMPIELDLGNIGDSFEFTNSAQQEDYIVAVGVKINPTQIQIVIQGDYLIQNNIFNVINMRTGNSFEYTGNILTLQNASSLADYPASQNPEKQITVLKDLELNRDNIVFASLDYNSDGVYNWVRIGGYANGKDGTSVWGINSTNASMVYYNIKVNDTIVAVEAFSYNGTDFKLADIYLVTQISPSIELSLQSNIQGPQGEPGQKGLQGEPGQNGLTPTIQEGYWWIGETNTGVKALGEDGTNGQDGKAFNVESGLFSTIENEGKQGNETPEGGALNRLPTLPQTGISGKGYVVYDPLTTPLQPYYDLYWANDGDTEWSIMHPFGGLAGKDGTNGETPYIKDNNWWIGETNTGIQATGTSGATGATGPSGVSMWALAKTEDFKASNSPFVKVGDYIVAGGNITYPSGGTSLEKGTVVKVIALSETSYDPGYFNIYPVFDSTFNAMKLTGPQGPQGAKGNTGATPNISATATSLPAGTEPTVNVSGSAENPIINFGIPQAQSGGGSGGGLITYTPTSYNDFYNYLNTNKDKIYRVKITWAKTYQENNLFALMLIEKQDNEEPNIQYHKEPFGIVASQSKVFNLTSQTNGGAIPRLIAADANSNYYLEVYPTYMMYKCVTIDGAGSDGGMFVQLGGSDELILQSSGNYINFAQTTIITIG